MLWDENGGIVRTELSAVQVSQFQQKMTVFLDSCLQYEFRDPSAIYLSAPIPV